MNAGRRVLSPILATVFLLSFVPNGLAGPCCIVVVPPPPPPSAKESQSASFGEIYAQLPLLVSLEKRLFGTLKVTIERTQVSDAVARAISTRGVVGIAPINRLAELNGKSNLPAQVIAVAIDRPDYNLFTRSGGPATVEQLRGKEIGIPGVGTLEHLYVLKTLRAGGLSESAVRFAVEPSWGNPSAKLLPALKTGKIAAAPLFLGFMSSKYDLGQIRQPVVKLPSWVIYAGPQTLREESAEVQQFLRGLQEGLKSTHTDKSTVKSILSREFKLSDDEANILLEYLPVVLPTTMKPNVTELDQTADLLRTVGITKQKVVFSDESTLERLYGQSP
jgi:ABC-type nitrate/sulfonate/bicarbonate transport system substrate-binding protein